MKVEIELLFIKSAASLSDQFYTVDIEFVTIFCGMVMINGQGMQTFLNLSEMDEPIISAILFYTFFHEQTSNKILVVENLFCVLPGHVHQHQ